MQTTSRMLFTALPRVGRSGRVSMVWRYPCSLRRQIVSSASTHEDISQVSGSLDAAVSLSRRDRIRNAKPFSEFLTDTFHRQHDYLRISVTERCNLRCVYCMPEEGVPLSPNRELLTTPEIVMLSSIFVSQGVNKIRLTGGEPTVRRDILSLMRQIGALRPRGLKQLCITTNGISLHRKLDSMVEAGLTGVNLSLDTLDPWQFQIMTRRKGFDAVQKSIERILEMNKMGAGIKLKINCVVMRGINDREVLPFVELTREKDLEVRFIEYMPFDGNKWNKGKMFSYAEMLDLIREQFPGLAKVKDDKNDTSKTWHIPGFVGRIGFITSMTHNFCGTCNRLRITGDGNLKVCLFGNAEVSLRDILRKSNRGEPIDEEAYEAMKQIEMDRKQGRVPPDQPLGVAPNEAELLDVIGIAVKGKKAKHAGLGTLEHMKNRPMILIGG
ncbi:molybdenum cofactor biosynthesis protein 1 B, partial [Metarhizium majus ARSEF 297]